MTVSLFFAPHPDDEIIGAGAHLALAHLNGDAIKIVVVTDGGLGGDRDVRRAETLAGAAALGLPDTAWTFWNCPDGAVPLNATSLAAIHQLVAEWRPHRIYLPAPAEQHPDHRRVTRAVLLALTGKWRGELWFYETVSPMPFVNRLQPAEQGWVKKQAALACHASQTAQFDYASLTNAIGSLRGMAAGYARAEGFLVYDWDGSPQNFFEAVPLLSIVMRASRAEYLIHALNSVAAQEYDMIEVVLVWFGVEPPPLDRFPGLQITVVAGGDNRADNLNRGVAAASGEFLAILDEDDVVDASHYANLINELRTDPRIDVAYTGTRLQRCRLAGDRVVTLAELQTFQEPVSPQRLLLGNVLPIHAFACRTALLRGYAFDPTLGAYEDWDMLLRLAFDGRHFRQVEGITAEYRLFGEEADLVERHRQRGYERWAAVVQGRYVGRLQPAHLAALYDRQHRLQQQHDAAQAALRRVQVEVTTLRARAAAADEQDALLNRVAARLPTPLSATGNTVRTAALALARSGPTICVVMPVYNTPPELLDEAVQSVLDQAYPNWTFCIVDDGSTRPDTLATLKAMADTFAHDGRVRIRFMDRNQGIVATTNVAVTLDDSPWIAFFDHDDRLDAEALFHIALTLSENPQARLAYTDNRLIDRAGALLNTYSKPDWSPALLLSCNYINHLAVIDRTFFDEIGGLHDEYEGAQDYGLMLECVRRLRHDEVVHIARPLYDWRTTETSVAYDPQQKPHSATSSFKAIEHHLARLGKADVRVGWEDGYPGIHAGWSATPRSMHAVIVSRDNETGLGKLLEALMACDTHAWQATVVLARADADYAAGLQRDYAACEQIRWLRDERPLNWSASANRAARSADTSTLLFLADHVLPVAATWLPRMLRYLELNAVGIVGARLQLADGGVRHLGVLTDVQDIATESTDPGARQERAVSREVSAVRRDVMLVDAALFRDIGGFDERLPSLLNDVDFCLHARARGHHVMLACDAVWITSHVAGAASEPRQLEAEQAIVRSRWPVGLLQERYDTHYDLAHRSTRILHVAGGEA
ncbi:MAG: glycosyltransferase [Burkholderiales bacterium]|nr:glycosyltransferase [Burkholderiales bacterium]